MSRVKNAKKLLSFALALLFLAALPAYASEEEPPVNGVGMNVSDLVSVDFNGEPVDGSIFSETEITVINIWQRWCGPCWVELPFFLEVYEHYSATPEADVQIWGALYYNSSENIQQAIDYVNEFGYSWRHMLMCDALERVAATLGSPEHYPIPQTLIIDGSGTVRAQIQGSIQSTEELLELTDYWLGIVRSEHSGDADGDGDVTAADALLTLRCAMEIIRFDEEEVLRADCDCDGVITSADALMILRKALGISEER